MVGFTMRLHRGASIDTLELLEITRKSINYAAGLNDPGDHRLCLVALRTIATTEGRFGQVFRERTLLRAIDTLGRSDQYSDLFTSVHDVLQSREHPIIVRVSPPILLGRFFDHRGDLRGWPGQPG